MQAKNIHRVLGLSIVALLAGGATLAQAEQVWARVISATPVNDSTGMSSYNVTYEYGGRQYTTRSDTRPGQSISIEVGSYGVATTAATTSPVAPQQRFYPQTGGQSYQSNRPDWDNVTPEPGVVVSSAPRPVYAQPVPVYSQPAPVYYQPAPVYVQPGYYPQPYAYPPIGLSLNLGYSRGWGGGHGRWR